MGNLRASASRTSRSGARGPRAGRSPGSNRVAVKVTFVVFKGEVNAIFRAVRGSHGEWVKEKTSWHNPHGTGRLVQLVPAYAHVGQHCEVDASLLKCRRATYEEYAPLLAEMRSVGYDVEVVQRGRLRLKEETGYAACWMDEYDNNDFGVYKVFRDRGAALDYLTDTVFERAELLGVDVTDQSAKPVLDEDDCWTFPKMTWQQVRDQLGSGMDFGLVLRAEWEFGFLSVKEQACMGIREVNVE